MDSFAGHFEEYLKEFQEVAEKLRCVLGTSRLILSEAYDTEHDFSDFLSAFSRGTKPPEYQEYQMDLPMHAACTIAGQSSAAVLAYRFPETQRYTGSMAVAAYCLSLGTLWNQIRVLGGAYGAGMSIRYNRNMLVYSYRDPTPDRSLAIFGRLSEAVKVEAASDRLEQSIIACISSYEPLMTAKDEAFEADLHYLTGQSYEETKRVRSEMLATSADDLLSVGPLLDDMQKYGAVCVIGHAGAVEKCSGLEKLTI